jgi:hypothetical protein
MSDTATEATETVVEEQPDGQAEQKPADVDWKAKAREWERRAKQNSDAAKRLAEIEDSQKTEAQKQAEAFAAAQERAAQAELRAMRLEVAHAKGLTPSQAKRLVGSTREELEADAEEILADFRTLATAGGKTAPKPDPSQGSRPGAKMSGREQGLAEAERRFGKRDGK